jgi:hypothetical protein
VAVASLIAGLLWFFWVGSIVALILGYTAQRQIRRSDGWQEGREFAIVGIVLGWIGVGILALILIVAAAFAILDDDDEDDATRGRDRISLTMF